MRRHPSKRSIAYQIVRFLFLGLYIASMVVLIVEAATPSKESARKSDATGTAISNIINDFNGDTAIEILPEECQIVIPKLEYSVGESTTIKVQTIPEEATYKSYTYTSSDTTVADINEFGEINFLKAGVATIKVTNTKEPTVFSTVVVTVKNVELESFTSKINASLKSGVYQLELNSSYIVTNTFKPANATFKDVTYEFDETLNYITMEDDTILVMNSSEGVVFDLVVKCGELSNTLQLTTIKKEAVVEDYPLVGFIASNVTKYVDQTSEFTPSISYNPSYVSNKYKGYSLNSENTDVVTVNGTKLKPVGTIGSSKITITSTYDSSITGSFTVTVKDRPTLNSITISKYSSTMYVEKTQTITVSTNPSTGLSLTKTFTSSDTTVATVTNSGVVTAEAVGSTSITASFTDKVHNITKTASVTISVHEPPVYTVTDIEIGYKRGENPIVYAGDLINLKDYFYIKTYIGNSNPTNKDYTFYIDTSIYPGSLEGDCLYVPNLNGEVTAYINYVNEESTVISKEIVFTVLSAYNIVDENNEPVSSTTFYVKERKQFSIVTENGYGQRYKVTNNSPDLMTLSFDRNNISIYIKQAGSGSFTITPIVTIDDTGVEFASNSKTVNITTNERYTTSLGLKFYDSNKEEIEFADTDTIMVYLRQTITYKVILDDATSLSLTTVKSNNECLTVRNNTLVASKIGDAIVSVKEQYSDITKLYKVKIRNRVLVDEKKAFLITGYYDYDANTNTLSIVNGNSVTIKYNFSNNSTYRKIIYTMENEEIATIGSDGTITPKMVGETTLSMVVQDELSVHATSTINIKILRKDFIENMHDFLVAVRKAIGHFGAFLLLGVIATITYSMFFKKDMYLFGLGINLSSGYFFGALTEEIQRHTAGRNAAMSDVVIDFRGYIIGVAFVILIVIVVMLVKLLVKRHKKRKIESQTKD